MKLFGYVRLCQRVGRRLHHMATHDVEMELQKALTSALEVTTLAVEALKEARWCVPHLKTDRATEVTESIELALAEAYLYSTSTMEQTGQLIKRMQEIKKNR